MNDSNGGGDAELKIEVYQASPPSSSSKKDIWDKFSAISSSFSAVVIAIIGIVFTHVYNEQQLKVQTAATIAQFLPSLGSTNPNVQQVAYQNLITLGYADFLAKNVPANSSLRAAFAVQSTVKTTSAQATTHLQAIAVQGIDVSGWNGIIDWGAVARTGVSFALIKATDGTKLKDDSLIRNWIAARGAGLTVGAYHYYVVREDGAAQARWFLQNTPKLTAADLPPVLDVESAMASSRATLDGITTWLTTVERETGHRPMVYAPAQIVHAPELLRIARQYPVWVAQYENVTTPEVTPWAVWQYSSEGKVSGISGSVNLDVFNGNKAAFTDFIASASHP